MKTPRRPGKDPAVYILKNPPALLVLTLAGAALNLVLPDLLRSALGLPLFMDTLFTMVLTWSGGLFWGILTGLLTNAAYCFIHSLAWTEYLYALCNAAVALITALFIRLFPGELGFPPRRSIFDRMIVLIILSFALSIAISLMGGIIASIAIGKGPELQFEPELRRRGLPVVAAAVLSRIPINVLDRLVSTFGAYGTALLIRRTVLLVRRFRNSAGT